MIVLYAVEEYPCTLESCACLTMAAANSARHEAFSELYNLSYNLSHTQKEDFVVPEITVVGMLSLLFAFPQHQYES